MDDEELEFDPGTVICEKCGGIVKFIGGGRYECLECGHIVLDDFGKVKEFLERRGPSNIMEISYATGLERSVVAKLLMDGRIQVLQNAKGNKTCANCGLPIAHGKYCKNCSDLLSKRRKKEEALKDKQEHGGMRFIQVDTSKHKKKK